MPDQSLTRASSRTFIFTALGLACNLVSGLLTARALSPSGRGALAAIVVAPGIATWVFGMGAEQANAFARAKDPKLGPTLLTTWTLLVVPLWLLATIAIELALPLLLRAQSAHVLFLARLFAPYVGLAILSQLMSGTLLGSHDYRTYNFLRLLQWIVLTSVIAVLYIAGRLTVESALLATIASLATPVAIAVWRVITALGGYGRPSWQATKASFIYGIKAHGSNFGSIVNARLDILIMPAFLGATSVGLYSVGTNVSWIIVVVAGSIAPIILPAATARGSEGPRTITKALHATMIIGTILATGMAIIAKPALGIIYGHSFQAGATALILLLPGCVLFACSQVLWSGLNAANRPLTNATTQIPGILITVCGLSLLLRKYGINAASIISSISYSVVFICAAYAYAKTAQLKIRTLLVPSPQLLTELWHAIPSLITLPSIPRKRTSHRGGLSLPRVFPLMLATMLVALGIGLGLIITALPSSDATLTVVGITGFGAIVACAIKGRTLLNQTANLPHVGFTEKSLTFSKNHDLGLGFFYAGMATIAFLPLRISIFPLSDIFFAASLCVTLATNRSTERRRVAIPSGVVIGLLIFIGGGIVASFFSSSEPSGSMLALGQFTFATGLWFYTAGLVLRNTTQILHAARWWVLSAAICGLWAVGQKAGLLPGLQMGDAGRAAGLAEQVNNLGGVCAVALLPAIALLYFAQTFVEKSIGACLLTAIGAGLIVSGSISAAVGALCGLVVGLFAKELTQATIRTLAIAAVAFILVGSGNLTGNQLARFSTTINPNAQNGQDSFYSRLNVVEIAWNQHIKTEPLIGVGLDKKSNTIYSEISHAEHQVHNLLIGDWYEVGLLGLIGITLMIVSAGVAGWTFARNCRSRDDQIFALALIGSMVTFFVFSMGEPIRDQRFALVPICLVIALYSSKFAPVRSSVSSTRRFAGMTAIAAK